MRNVAILISRDFLTRVKGGSYIITTILGVLVIIALTFVPAFMEWIETKFDQTDVHLIVLDKTNALASKIEFVVAQQYGDADYISVTAAASASETDAIAQMAAENKTGVLVIEWDELGKPIYSLHTSNAENINQNSIVQRIVNQANLQYNADQLGLSFEDVAMLTQSPYLHVKTVNPDAADGAEEAAETLEADTYAQSLVLAYLLLFILYMALVLYGNMVATGVAEEKSSRIMEVMVSTVKPIQLMIGKIFGIGSLGLLQFVIWISTGILVATMKNLGISLGSIPIGTLVWFALFFVLGYLFYAAIFAAGGAVVSRVEEVQQVNTLLMMGLVVGFIIAYMSFLNPNGSLATVVSIIPFFSPMVMFARVALTNPPWIQIIVSLLLLILGTAVNTWIAAKIYRVGILMYGKRPRMKEIFRYIVN
ncbi:MAG: ABC transporter permease [Firmicutes bacterium]|nr:ABC transporter permease [Bacillota bacterium]